MLPTINPFFEEFQITAFTKFQIKMGEEHAKRAELLLLRKYDFLLVMFSKEDDT